MSAVELPPAEVGPAREPVAHATPPLEHAFEFHGDALEYFRIWIVNVALSVVTLGIYSAWAKVRTQRYFYANTRVAGAPFEYLAQPLPILKGRALAVLLFGSYVLSGHFLPKAQIALALLIAVLSPWLIVRGLRFHARYSAWRTLNFRFVGKYADAYIRFLAMYLLVPITLGIAYPYVRARQKRFVVESHRYGGKEFRFHARDGEFYPPYLIAFFSFIGWWIGIVFGSIMLMAPFMRGSAAEASKMPQWPILVMAGLMYAGIFVVAIYLASRIANLVYNNSEIDGHRLLSTLRARDLVCLYLTNTLAILGSVGMLIPWAMVRMARYRASRLTLLAAGDLDAFFAVASAEEGATGAEMDALFDIDIGF